MKDMLGVPVDIGDIILSAASREGGYVKLGKVYGFDKQGHPLIKFVSKDYDYESHSYAERWRKGSAGSTVIVLMKAEEYAISGALLSRIDQDYDSDTPKLG